jgi:protein-lysine N-methyltransferase EEF2KMT
MDVSFAQANGDMTINLSAAGLQNQVKRFCSQYLQLERNLDYPDSHLLRQSEVQRTIYRKLFVSNGTSYPAPERYQLRVLKELVRRIEASIENWEIHVSVFY